MTTNNHRLSDALRERQILLFRHQATLRREIDKLLAALEAAIVANILAVAPNDVARETFKTMRVLKLIDEVEALITASYRDIRNYHVDQLSGMAEAEALFLIAKVNEILRKDLAKAVKADWLNLAKTTLMTGAPMKDWWAGQAESTKQRFSQQMRIGLLGGDSDADLVKRVRGTRGMGFKDGMMQVSRRHAAILVRGASAAVSSEVRKVAVEDNPRVFRGIQQISVFDGRTSEVCMAYAGKVWEVPGYKPVGHSLPYNGGVPRHPNCRSTEVAVLTEEFGGEPADDVSFDTFLKGKSPAQVDALLGMGKGAMYRAGKITLNDLVDQNGRGVTLEALQASPR